MKSRPPRAEPEPEVVARAGDLTLDPAAEEYYRAAMAALDRDHVPFLVGGAYAMAEYAGIVRHTKDFDVFVRRSDAKRALRALARVSDRAEPVYPYWIAKAYRGEYYVDVIYGSANGLEPVDDAWFAHAVPATVLGVPVQLVPPAEILAQKCFVQERERYDGADVAHLLRSQATRIDWSRLLKRFGDNWRVLFSQLILFGFIYPSERDKIPRWVLDELVGRWKKETDQPPEKAPVCRGTLLSRQQYLPDVEQWGYLDARRWPKPLMTEQELEAWTAGIAIDGSQ